MNFFHPFSQVDKHIDSIWFEEAVFFFV